MNDMRDLFEGQIFVHKESLGRSDTQSGEGYGGKVVET